MMSDEIMIDADDVSKRIFIITVAAATIAPRMPFDKLGTIGGICPMDSDASWRSLLFPTQSAT